MEAIGKIISAGLSFIHIVFLKLIYHSRFKAGCIQDISPSTRITAKGKITLEKKVHTRRNVEINSMSGGEIIIGNDCFFNNGCMIVSKEQIKIGAFTSCGPNVMIYDHDHKIDKDAGFIHGEYKSAPISIGEHVWIGANTVILAGTVIGDRCVIGAGCALKGRYESGSVIVQKRVSDIMRIKEE